MMKIKLLLLLPIFTFSQVKTPKPFDLNELMKMPNIEDIYNKVNPNYITPQINVVNMFGTDQLRKTQQQNQQLINQVDAYRVLQKQQMQEVQNNISTFKSTVNYHFKTSEQKEGTSFYKNTFENMLLLDENNYSLKDVNFNIENTFFDNKLNKAEFNKAIKQSGEFILAKIKELNYDLNSNTAKNFMLFKFFSQTMQLKGSKIKHLSLKYDFEDLNGDKNWSQMFVIKLIKTGKGQCHSLPLLYLTLAEEIGATAYLALSPKHSYIKFQDENQKWYNIELTNGMFTTQSFILNNGFVRSEALQNNVYMTALSKKELLAHLYSDLAMGYEAKFGIDDFIEKVAQKALQMYPNGIAPNMLLSNFNTYRFEYAMKKLGINPTNKTELQNIKNYPETVQWLNATNQQYAKIDDLGYQDMPKEAYQKWLGTLKQEKNKQENEALKNQFKGLILQKPKN